MTLNAEQLKLAKAWIADCFDDVEVSELTNIQVERGIARHFDGGISAFLLSEGY